ncbi:uncharacterized protein F4822DRAFT_386677 [Hypoxylon trugodes]|uniref:uncharacterized protein n=1 Tax=Hypoxylon trugodes TaxID=326681 RepID=UPI0021944D22|nr:uncharacterized protein F4822DRAFT_386677 [Hypoxylon trugodes]KAI1393975.1 hypothetical protein F4822DRAFT_386677 [Hypoxylon trugodes]
MDSPTVSQTLAHDDRANVLIGAVCLVCTIATTVVALRFYTRSFMLKQLGIDDYLIFVAWAFALATGVSQCLNTRNGLGKHVWDLGSETQLRRYLKGFYVSITLYNVGLMFVKLAFLAQYYRVLTIKRMRKTFLSAMVIIGCWSLSQVIVGIFICDPVSGFWEKSSDPTCIPNYPQWYINAAGNIASDIAIFILPLPVIGHLHLPKAQRLVLIGIFSLGFFTCAISVIRIKFLQQGGDFSYENVEGSSWSITELCSGVICACLPTLRPLVSKWVPALSNRLHRRHSDMEKGTRHRRDSSDASRILAMKKKDDFFYCIGLEERESGSADSLDGSMELKGDRDSFTSRGSSSPTLPSEAHIVDRAARRPTAYYNWMASSVTTKIGTGGNKRPSADSTLSSSSIQVQRDVVMHKV